jgi:hypothetical protein
MMKKTKKRPKCPLWASDNPSGLCVIYDQQVEEIELLKERIRILRNYLSLMNGASESNIESAKRAARHGLQHDDRITKEFGK